MADKPSGLEILVDEKVVNDLLLQQRGAKAVLRSAANVLLFVCFLTSYTVIALGEPFRDMRTFEGFIRRRFDTEAAMPLHDVESIDTFWRYTNLSFTPALYGNDTSKYYQDDFSVERFLLIEGSNRLLGVARMRMVKMQSNIECAVAKTYQSAFPLCYGPYTEEAEDTSMFGPLSSVGKAGFEWSSDERGDSYAGKISTYGPGGFMQSLTSNYNESVTTLTYIQESGWVTSSTRAVFLDWTVYNFNVGLYAVCKIVFEVAPSGKWEKTFDVDILSPRHLRVLGFGTSSEWFMLIIEFVLLLFVIRYFIEEASEFVGCKRRATPFLRVFPLTPSIKTSYFFDAWNILDLVNLALILVTLIYRAATWIRAADLDDPAAQSNTFVDLGQVAQNINLIHELVAFNAVLTWFKAVKYINIFPYITILMQTVIVSQRQLITWIVVFTTTLIGFILALSVAFGTDHMELATPWKAFVFLMRVILGNADMEVVYSSSPFLGSILVGIFVVMVIFILMALFYSIMIRALQEAKETEDAKAEKRWEQTVSKLKSVWTTISTSLRLELRFRLLLPRFYSRLQARKKQIEARERLRDERLEQKQRQRNPWNPEKALGPASPTWGRRKLPRGAWHVGGDDDQASDAGSEADLGPLRNKEQLMIEPPSHARPILDRGMTSGSMLQLPDVPEADEGDAVDLVIDATKHVANGIVQRTHGARTVLFGEMAEAREVLNSIGAALEVLSRRARDIEAQQNQMVMHF